MLLIVGAILAATAGAGCDDSSQVCTDDTAPDKTHVLCTTTMGPLMLKMQPSVSPLGVQRVKQLVEDGFFDSAGEKTGKGVALYRNLPGFLVQFGQQSAELMARWEGAALRDDTPARPPQITRGTLFFAGNGPHSRTAQLALAYCKRRECREQGLGRQPWETAVARVVGRVSAATLDKLEREAHSYGDMAPTGAGPDPRRIASDPHYASPTESYLSRSFPRLEYITGCALLDDAEAKQFIAGGAAAAAEDVARAAREAEEAEAAELAAAEAERVAIEKAEREEAEALAAKKASWRAERDELWSELVAAYGDPADEEGANPAVEQPEYSETTLEEGSKDADGECRVRAGPGDSLWIEYNASVANGPQAGTLYEAVSRFKPLKREVGDKHMPLVGLRQAFHGACINETRAIVLPARQAYGASGLKDNVMYPVPPHAAVRLEARVLRINGWEGHVHAPDAPASLRALPAALFADPGFCTLNTASGSRKFACRMGEFGPQGKTFAESGLWAPPSGSDAEMGCRGSLAVHHGHIAGNALLLRRGGCPFFEKYKEAARYRPKVVIIADNAPLGPAGLIGLSRGGEAEDACERGEDAPPALAVSKEEGDRLAKEVRAGISQHGKLPGLQLSFSEYHRDVATSRTFAVQLRDAVREQDERAGAAAGGAGGEGGAAESTRPPCGVVPRLALNLAVGLARAHEFDLATSTWQTAMRVADQCAELSGEGEVEGEGEGKMSAALNTTERASGYAMLAALLADWGHVRGAVDAATRARAINPKAPVAAETRVRCDTTKGSFQMSLFRQAAPLGFDRFIDLVHTNFYNGSAFYRVTDDLAQWGFAATHAEQARYTRHNAKLEDDVELNVPLERGTISFHGHGRNSRHTSVFVAKRFMPPSRPDDMMRWAETDWMRGFGRVTHGMDTIDALYAGYGEVEREDAPPGVQQGPNMLQVQLLGNKYMRKEFPLADYMKNCSVLGAVGML